MSTRNLLPAEPFIEFLRAQLDRRGGEVAALAMALGKDGSRVRKLVDGVDSRGRPIRFVALDTVDQAVCALRTTESLHTLYPEEMSR